MPESSADPIPNASPAPSTAPRAFRYAFYALLVLLALFTTSFFVTRVWLHRALRDSLPQLDGAISTPGLAAPVTVQRDSLGTPHIRAASLDDLAFAQGYVTAQDRLWQMDIFRRNAAGDLAEILGASMLAHDHAQRVLLVRSTADAITARLSPSDLRYLAAYAAGVNTLIAQQSTHLPVEFRVLRYAPRPWQPRDSILVALMMAQELTTTFPIELAREQIAAKLPPELIADLYPVGSWRDHPPGQPPPDLTQPQPEIPDVPLDESQTELRSPAHLGAILALERSLSLTTARFTCAGCRSGSNAWAVSGAHTASGLPLLANDMHLSLTVPGTWYAVDLAAPAANFHAAGISLPGLPFVVAGRNDHISWGFTNLGAAAQDVTIEHLRNHAEYQDPDGSWHLLAHHSETIAVRGGSNVTLDVLSTARGPIITPLLRDEHRDLSLSWTIYNPSASGFPLLALNSASDWPGFCAALSLLNAPALNAVYADAAGHIGYHAAGSVPVRGSLAQPAPIPTVPVDVLAAPPWVGSIPFDQLPHSYDPPEGFLAVANSRITPDGYAFPISLDWDSPFRAERIGHQLLNSRNLKPVDMLALQMDIHSAVDLEIAHRIAYAIDHIPTASKQLRQAADLLRSWNGEVDMHSPAANTVSAATDALWPMLLQPRLGRPGGNEWQAYTWGESTFVLEELIVHQPARWLPPHFADWNQLLAAATEQGLRTHGAPFKLELWPYGHTHFFNVSHPFFGASSFLRAALDLPVGSGPTPYSGDATTVRQMKRNFGPSERMTADLADPNTLQLTLLNGESGNVLSPWFSDQWSAWYTGTPLQIPYSPAASSAAAAHTLVLQPRPQP